MLRPFYHCYVGNKPVETGASLIVTDKYTGKEVCKVALADSTHINAAIEAAVHAAKPLRQMAPFERAEILQHAVSRFKARFDELAQALCIEAGKPLRDAKGEVTRLIDTFEIAAREALQFGGEYTSLEISPRAAGYESITKRVPIGPCSFISPFNFPLNLVAHKVAPAIAVGAPFILKPASKTPIGALIIGQILAETRLPEGAFSILPASRDGADLFTTDNRLKLLSFTGSPDVGWALKRNAGKKKVILELGGNAACVVEKDANLDFAAKRIALGAFYQSGQSCISVQRIFVHEDIYDDMIPKLIAAAKTFKAGNPKDESTTLGPIISRAEAERIENWIYEAVSDGAKILCGGQRNDAFVEATLLAGTKPHHKVNAEEVFGPVATIHRYRSFKDVINQVNEGRFGLQAGVFTKNLDYAFYAWNELEVGGVVINDIPSFRVDSMPYGGVKDSGLGREGIRYAMEDMSEIRLMVLNRIGRL
ncbi:MAG: aldehyde dehydrogenase family protein [Deltaproteobacteria bacterium]|nr:aldehyde dehydrogenase family protein [Deltaproteobacteria bacterium]